MNNWKVIPTIVFATVLIFGAGVFTGGLLVNHVKSIRPVKKPAAEKPATNALAIAKPATASNTNSPEAKPANRAPEILSKEFLQRLDLELRLSAAQHDAIQKIINDGQGAAKKIVNDARSQIREKLKPEQARQFDAIVKPASRKTPSANDIKQFRKQMNQIMAEAATNPPSLFTATLYRLLARQVGETNLPPEIQAVIDDAEGSARAPEKAGAQIEIERLKALERETNAPVSAPPSGL